MPNDLWLLAAASTEVRRRQPALGVKRDDEAYYRVRTEEDNGKEFQGSSI